LTNDFRFLFPKDTQAFPAWQGQLSLNYRQNEEEAVARLLEKIRISEQQHQDIEKTSNWTCFAKVERFS
jgi:hypothetical protein